VTPALGLALGVSAAATGVAGACVHHATYAVRSQWLGQSDWRGAIDSGSVALTFDDGPTDDTERILDTLAAFDLRATFFMIGRHVERHPRIARRVVAEGHDVGNHSYSHPIYLYRSPRETRRQLERTQQVIAETTGVRPCWSRPPCGVRTRAYFRISADLGLRTVLWTVAGDDWKPRIAEQITHQIVSGLSAGAIVLLHDGDSERRRDRRETVVAVPRIIAAATARGLAVQPLGRLLDVERHAFLQDGDVNTR
jgi:peptidoglycan-N-acetylglucosamine deacetylase